MGTRTSKLSSVDLALDGLEDGQTLIIGGSLFHNKPMYLVREIIRRQIKDLIVVSVPQASIDVDLLISAGCVAEVRVPYMGFEYLGLAPSFRKAASNGKIRVWECDETHILAALEASARKLPSGIAKAGVGTDVHRLNPDLKLVKDHISGEPMTAVAALKPDLAIMHAAAGDKYGNLRYSGYSFADLMVAEATRQGGGKVVASVDEVVPNASFTKDPFRTNISCMLIDHVIEAPYGAYPCSSHGSYQFNEAAIVEYLNAAKTEQGALDYIDDHVMSVPSHDKYLSKHVNLHSLIEAKAKTYVD
ncbi:CoA-transferase [uncultured Sneathiella sp.]|uniref:CoA transferase subunit A n=1 Tax=uncultured Sneathiella sp. TaxID=879315 RepID=UPI0025997B8F|nr:CoA-transferase [uncultured Sneathiella sp.]